MPGPKKHPLIVKLRLNKPGIVIISLEEWCGPGGRWMFTRVYLKKFFGKSDCHGCGGPYFFTKADNLEGETRLLTKIVVKTACQYQAQYGKLLGSRAEIAFRRDYGPDRFHLTVGTYDFFRPGTIKNRSHNSKPYRPSIA
jgi:hypothetical protein